LYEKILVPLDGSKLAESVLPYVEEVAQRCDTQNVILISVTERIRGMQAVAGRGHYEAPIAGTPISSMDQAWETARESTRDVPVGVGKMQKQADRYLNRIAKRLQSKGIKVSTEVLLGDPAEEIMIYAKIKPINLIAMSSHGRSGISRWTHGSVADRVFRSVDVPVLMVRAPGSKAST